MLDRRIKELRSDALAALIGSNDEAHDRADIARGFARNAFELRLRRGVAPANDATEAVPAVRRPVSRDRAPRGRDRLRAPTRTRRPPRGARGFTAPRPSGRRVPRLCGSHEHT